MSESKKKKPSSNPPVSLPPEDPKLELMGSSRFPMGKGFLNRDEDLTEYGRRFIDDETELESVVSDVTLGILWVLEGPRRGQIIKIRVNSTIGRSEGQIVIDDPKVSNPHAKITFENGKFFIWDFGSRNGTYVNGNRIRIATLLHENDIIKIGDRLFVIKILDG